MVCLVSLNIGVVIPNIHKRHDVPKQVVDELDEPNSPRKYSCSMTGCTVSYFLFILFQGLLKDRQERPSKTFKFCLWPNMPKQL